MKIVSVLTLLIALAAFAGCAETAPTGAETAADGRTFEFSVGGGARAIDVTTFDVTGMDMAIVDRGTGLAAGSFTWLAADGKKTFALKLKSGSYTITVTHHGVKDGETISLSESADFVIAVRKITRVTITPGAIGTVIVADAAAPVFFNKLGSLAELGNGVAGGPITPGALASFVPGVDGGALFSPDAGAIAQRPYFRAQGFRLDSFSIEFSVKVTGRKDGRPRTILDRIVDGDQGLNFTCRNGYTAYNSVFQVYTGRATGNPAFLEYTIDHASQAGTDAFFPEDTWVRIAVTVDAQAPAGQRVKIWRDGVLQATTAQRDDALAAAPADFDLMLMATHYWENDGFLGAMDEIKIYDYAKNDYAAQP